MFYEKLIQKEKKEVSKERMKPVIVIISLYLGVAGISMNVSGKPPSPPASSVHVTNTPQVEVTNTPDVNVANKLDVNVTNTPGVNVTNKLDMNITNTPDVNVANTANVNVTNTPDVNVVNGLDVTVSNDSPILVKNSNIYRFSGFSKSMVSGDSGLAALHAACQSSFGGDARMCTSKEIFETPSLSSITTG
jgi:hypothetical protein